MSYDARVVIPATGQMHTGRSYDSIARRVWGHKAHVELSPDPNSRVGRMRQAVVLRPYDGMRRILCHVLVWTEGGDEKE